MASCASSLEVSSYLHVIAVTSGGNGVKTVGVWLSVLGVDAY